VLAANAVGYCALVESFGINSFYMFIFKEKIILLALGICTLLSKLCNIPGWVSSGAIGV
jgi:hypothetical protein